LGFYSTGIYPLIANTVAIVAGNSEGAYVRSVVTAVVISFGNINGKIREKGAIMKIALMLMLLLSFECRRCRFE